MKMLMLSENVCFETFIIVLMPHFKSKYKMARYNQLFFFLRHLFYLLELLQNTLQKLVYITRLGHTLIILL